MSDNDGVMTPTRSVRANHDADGAPRQDEIHILQRGQLARRLGKAERELLDLDGELVGVSGHDGMIEIQSEVVRRGTK